jgi:murein DD-endopeptidase MepM/ murein hydrolase activator NlpD
MIKNGSDGETIILKVEEIMNQIEELELSKDKILETLGESKNKVASYNNLISYDFSNENTGIPTKNADKKNGENKIFLPKLAIAGIDPQYNGTDIVSTKHSILNKLEEITEDISRIHEKLKERNTIFEYFPTLLPVKGYITSRFGTRVHPIEGEEKFHTGIDIAAPYGSPVYATASGKVIRARKTYSGKGNYVMIKHINNLITVYLHLSRIIVKEGEFVKKGEIIGYIGTSGLATGPHLHYEVLFNGKPIDPLIFILED